MCIYYLAHAIVPLPTIITLNLVGTFCLTEQARLDNNSCDLC